MTIPVLEIFGPTVQGEGLLVGQKTMFVRTAGCDYRCSWCDSAFTWDGSAKDDIQQMTADDVIAELDRLAEGRYAHVTISGGNPALLGGIGELVERLSRRGVRTAVETQGSRWQNWLLDIDDVTLSPKPPSSGMDTDFMRLDEIAEKLWNRSVRKGLCLKVVVFNEEDMRYAIAVHERYPEIPFVMQTGNEDVHNNDDQELIQKLLRRYEWLIEQVALEPRLNRTRVLPQLHTLVWGNKRGV
ncbi:7-carboxy-7-deazaguanine synthase QueE [Paenibacillus alvei]|uniref:7-carboxy-7-deazaguanine synthase n=1 Tax=Paenibacillus alvei TaxID=44250 RepID=A0AAP7DKL1_PAEAL|nr:7-carboxy-7-deazaguanine synthase QueE [Paenibacillus alvei]NOJ72861.1 7-carboxy-7-deazaguanine synthase QueE [Paenibacillus alvei]